MVLVKIVKDMQVRLEAIPNPGAIFYNAVIKKILSKPELRIAQNIVQKIDKGILIDIGSGTGFLSIQIAKKAPNLTIYGIDLSSKMVEIASGNAKRYHNIRFMLGNARELPFETDSVDFIISTGSFHHWQQPIKVFNEIFRIMKSKGEAWIYDGCHNPPSEEVVKLKRAHGTFRYLIFSQIQKFHGFKWEIYNTKIKKLLEHTKFKENFQMILEEGWMKIILGK
jgi:ubiquinone/menaquinone biosynthesis C-methylase UbiE